MQISLIAKKFNFKQVNGIKKFKKALLKQIQQQIIFNQSQHKIKESGRIRVRLSL